MHPFTLTVVVPCLDEEENIGPVYEEIVTELAGFDDLEILFVDDGSTDETLDRIRSLAARDRRVSYLSFTRNFGVEPAFSAGYRYARNDWILHLDADLQFPPAEGRRLIETARTGYDAVFGIRVDRKDRWSRRVSSKVHDLIARRLLGIELPAGATTFRLVRASLARRIVDLRLGTPYFLATVPRLTAAWTTVPTAHRPRLRGEPKVRWRGLARHSVELFVSYSDRTMAAAVTACLLAALLAFAGLAATLAGVSASVLLCLAAGIALAALAVMGRYLVHIGRGQPRTPLFLVREANIPIAPADLLEPGPAQRPARLAAAS
ncbi:glycosyltransferase family 2 protein [Dactylosporangium sp. NPDC000244]|uniref:glycosyltransferase family 2 protein n=1 Tax=Dactylosporangium sp. NPDC000244 TaxID=3154365 RepID=UPI0033236BE3